VRTSSFIGLSSGSGASDSSRGAECSRLAVVSGGRTSARSARVWYLNCPRCGLTITSEVRLMAAGRCPRCLARAGLIVELFSSALPAEALYAEGSLPHAEPAPRCEPRATAGSGTATAKTQVPRELRVVARSRASSRSGASARAVSDPRDARFGDARARLRRAPIPAPRFQRSTSASPTDCRPDAAATLGKPGLHRASCPPGVLQTGGQFRGLPLTSQSESRQPPSCRAHAAVRPDGSLLVVMRTSARAAGTGSTWA